MEGADPRWSPADALSDGFSKSVMQISPCDFLIKAQIIGKHGFVRNHLTECADLA